MTWADGLSGLSHADVHECLPSSTTRSFFTIVMWVYVKVTVQLSSQIFPVYISDLEWNLGGGLVFPI